MEVELLKVLLFVNKETKQITMVTYSGNKTVSDGKFSASERFDINVNLEDMPAEIKIKMEQFSGMVLLPEINRITETVTSEQ